MSVKYMSRVKVTEYLINNLNRNYEYEKTLVYVDAEIKSDPVIVPDSIKNIVASLSINTSGTGKIQVTVNLLADVIAEAVNVIWYDWDSGSVNANTVDNLLCNITAIRAVCTAGSVTMNVRAA